MRRFAVVFALSAVLAEPALAVGVTINDDAGSRVTVVIENASVDAVLKALHERYGFELEGVSNLGSTDILTAKLTGSISEVVARLLRNWNHVIVNTPDAPDKISKVVIINANYGTEASKTKDEKAADQQIENAKKAAGDF